MSESPELQAYRLVVESIDSVSAERGAEYYSNGKVGNIRKVYSGPDRLPGFTAEAFGSDIYRVEIHPYHDVYSCTCPSYRVPCKHLMALALSLKNSSSEIEENKDQTSQNTGIIFDTDYLTFKPITLSETRSFVMKSVPDVFAANDDKFIRLMRKAGILNEKVEVSDSHDVTELLKTLACSGSINHYRFFKGTSESPIEIVKPYRFDLFIFKSNDSEIASILPASAQSSRPRAIIIPMIRLTPTSLWQAIPLTGHSQINRDYCFTEVGDVKDDRRVFNLFKKGVEFVHEHRGLLEQKANLVSEETADLLKKPKRRYKAIKNQPVLISWNNNFSWYRQLLFRWMPITSLQFYQATGDTARLHLFREQLRILFSDNWFEGPAPAISLESATTGNSALEGRVSVVYGPDMASLQKALRSRKPSGRLSDLAVFSDFMVQNSNYFRFTDYDSVNDVMVERNGRVENEIFTFLKKRIKARKSDGSFTVTRRQLKKFISETLPALEREKVIIRVSEQISGLLGSDMMPEIIIDEGSGIDWFDVNIHLPGVSREEREDIFNAVLNGDEILQTKNGRWFKLDIKRLRSIFNLLKKHGGSLSDLKVKDLSKARLEALLLEKELKLRSSDLIKKVQQRLDNLDEDPPSKISLPAGFTAKLRDYQQQGVSFLNRLDQYGLGGILADDMGLGKTVQALAFLNIIYNKNPDAKFLVVGPLAALRVWQKEAQKFSPDIPVHMWHGSGINHIPKRGLMITTFATLANNVYRLKSILFRVMLVDEAQYLRNIRTQGAQKAREVNTERIYCLTGTPVENRLTDLHALFDLFYPGFLGSSQEFKERFSAGNDPEQAERLKRVCSPFILRRTKQAVLKSLPPKTESTVPLALSPRQKKAYDKGRIRALAELRAAGGPSLFKILRNLTVLRRLACHADFNAATTVASNKLQYLDENLDELLESANGVLIFSQFTDMLDAVEKLLDKNDVNFYRIDGSTPVKKREAMVDAFQNDSEGVKIFLISLKAGGTALTLHRADTVIHLDPWWNPAAENQATDRAHRIGQKRKVFVYRLISENTVEEKVMQLQQKKRAMFNAMFSESEENVDLKIDRDLVERLLRD